MNQFSFVALHEIFMVTWTTLFAGPTKE